MKSLKLTLFVLLLSFKINAQSQSELLGKTKQSIYKTLTTDKKLSNFKEGKDKNGISFYSVKDTKLNSERIYSFRDNKNCDAVVLTFRYETMEVLIEEFNKIYKIIKPNVKWLEYGQKNKLYTLIKNDTNYYIIYINFSE